MHWICLWKMFQLNLESKAKEANWMMKLVGFQEMFTIVKGLKRGRAPGPDGILNEMLEIGWQKCCVLLLIWWSPSTGQMVGGRVILCHSLAGDEEVPGNYRGIALGNCVAKVMFWQVGSIRFQRIVFKQRVRVDSGQEEGMLIRS